MNNSELITTGPTSTSAPEILYHYASIGAIENILKTKVVWATHVAFMSDSQEFRYTLEVMQSVIEERQSNAPEVENYLRFLSAVVANAEANFMEKGFFAFCLSANGDLLSQWRSYCPPEGGYSIGFRKSDLESIFRPQDFHIMPCAYDKRFQKKFVAALLQSYEDRFRESGEASMLDIAVDLDRLPLTVKHPGFLEEQEWRAFSDPNVCEEWRYHILKGRAVPHWDLRLALPDNLIPIAKIIVGPCREQELALVGIRRMLLTFGYAKENVDKIVEPSTIPYRTP
jgi:hypothetical protein